jgi:hypothetical protein
MKGAEAVGEPRMLRALVSEMRQAKLADAAQALELGGIDQADKQLALVRIGPETNDVVNGIAVDLFRQMLFSVFLICSLILNREALFGKQMSAI